MVTNMWPSEQKPAYGIFIKRQVDSLRDIGLESDVLFVEGYRTRWDYARAALYMLSLNFSRHRPRLVHGHGGETALVVRWYVRSPVLVSYCGDDLLGEAACGRDAHPHESDPAFPPASPGEADDRHNHEIRRNGGTPFTTRPGAQPSAPQRR